VNPSPSKERGPGGEVNYCASFLWKDYASPFSDGKNYQIKRIKKLTLPPDILTAR
jgi:hypothetical protein